ncbi:hypothetical protein KFK09_026938 [Dendrobium nobile]|uniref:DUF7866 domain-containing protein n=1 Tax=Dendrobium nobile TaxID=94219 RepID=A0A8T3AA36_DENNO|nr:hypothetical protein KFK09_026938 [Dendrobium nobile]
MASFSWVLPLLFLLFMATISANLSFFAVGLPPFHPHPCKFSPFIYFPNVVFPISTSSDQKIAFFCAQEADGSAGSAMEEMRPVAPVPGIQQLMLNETRRQLSSFQICALCTCCGGPKGLCLPSPCCYAISCNIPNRPFGFCSFLPRTFPFDASVMGRKGFPFILGVYDRSFVSSCAVENKITITESKQWSSKAKDCLAQIKMPFLAFFILYLEQPMLSLIGGRARLGYPHPEFDSPRAAAPLQWGLLSAGCGCSGVGGPASVVLWAPTRLATTARGQLMAGILNEGKVFVPMVEFESPFETPATCGKVGYKIVVEKNLFEMTVSFYKDDHKAILEKVDQKSELTTNKPNFFLNKIFVIMYNGYSTQIIRILERKGLTAKDSDTSKSIAQILSSSWLAPLPFKMGVANPSLHNFNHVPQFPPQSKLKWHGTSSSAATMKNELLPQRYKVCSIVALTDMAWLLIETTHFFVESAQLSSRLLANSSKSDGITCKLKYFLSNWYQSKSWGQWRAVFG